MDKNKYIKSINDKDFVPGIYNYCDRWCEKCPLTHKCASYYISNKLFIEKIKDDGTNDFVAEIEKVLNITKKILEDTIKDLNIDMDIDEMDMENIPEIDDMAGFPDNLIYPENIKSEMIQLALDNIDTTNNWMYQIDPEVMEKEKEFERIKEMNIESGKTVKEFKEMMDAFDIIEWYQVLILNKLNIALYDKKHIKYEKDELIPYNGYAKVALIGIEKSIEAWQNLMSIFPDAEDSIFEQLIDLKKLKNKVLETFPDAEKFKRPGFDD